MKEFLKKFKAIGVILGLILIVGQIIPALAATAPLEAPLALFETSLASQISSSATTMTLVSGTTRDGTTLNGTYSFTISEGNADQEFVRADCVNTACTGLERGISTVTGTSTVSILQFTHRRGTSVKITDAPILLNIGRMLNGIGKFPNIISYLPTTSTSTLTGSNIPDVAWVLSQTQALTSVADDGRSTLTVSPSTGAVQAGINLGNSNVWTSASTTFVNGVTMGRSTTTSATTTSIFSTTASTTNLFVGTNALIGQKLGISTSTPTDALTVANNNSILVSENKVSTSTSQTIDWRQGNQQLMQIGTSAITVTHTNYLAGQHELVIVCNPASGTAGAITWSGVEWAGGISPVQTTTANICDAWSFIATQATSTTGALKIFGTAAVNIN